MINFDYRNSRGFPFAFVAALLCAGECALISLDDEIITTASEWRMTNYRR